MKIITVGIQITNIWIMETFKIRTNCSLVYKWFSYSHSPHHFENRPKWQPFWTKCPVYKWSVCDSPDHFKTALKDGSHFGQFSNGQAVQFSNGNKNRPFVNQKRWTIQIPDLSGIQIPTVICYFCLKFIERNSRRV